MRYLAFTAFSLSLAAANVASAGQCGYAYCWGAVGIGPNGAAGWSYDYSNESDAVNRVQSECPTCNNI